MIFTEAELDYLAAQPLGRLATMAPDGTLQINPVGFTWNPETGTIDIGGFDMSRTRKFRNVAANGRAAFVVDDLPSTDPWRVRCLDMRGSAEVIGGPGSKQETVADSSDQEIIRFRPHRIIAMGIDGRNEGPHDMELNARDVPTV